MKELYKKHQKFVFLLLVLLFSFVLNAGTLFAQTLKTDGAVPTLNACGANGTFTVTIARGAAACNAGTLKITLPSTGFEYVPGSAKIGVTVLAETNVTTNGTTLALPVIPAGLPTDLVTITYEAKATCEAIPLASLPDASKPTVTYTLSSCTATPQTGQSDIININFAVLKAEVTPNASQGVIGSIVTRTVKITNTGNGSIGSFTVDRALGSSLSITGVTQPAGWTVDASVTNKYVYSGSTLAPGATVQFTENVQINACTDMQTTFDAYYGCTGKCILGNANGTTTAGISIDQSIQPKLQVTANTTPAIICLNQEYEHIWTITNNGTGVSSATKFFLGLDGSTLHAGSYFNPTSISIDGIGPVTINPSDTQLLPAAGGDAFGTTGKIRQLSFNIPELAPGESKVIHFKQYYAAPIADCTKNLASFVRTYTAYSVTYKHRDGCNATGVNPDIVIPYTQIGNFASYGFSGTNVGEVDITDSYNADFLINNWNVQIPDVRPGAYFDIILDLSASIQAGFDMSAIKLFDPVANKYLTPVVTNIGPGKYQLRITYGTPDWPVNTALNSSSYHLQFPVTMTCATGGVSTPASYTVTGQLNNGGTCAGQMIQFGCQTVTLNTHCGITCPDGGLDNGTAVLKRMTYGQIAANPDNATPDLSAPAVDPNNPPANFATRYFIGTDKLQISQTGTVVHGLATPVGGWSAGTFSVSSPANLASVAVPGTGKVTITRGVDVYTVTGLAINTSILNTFSIDLSVANLLTGSNTLPAGFTYQDNDVIVSSLEIQPMELYNGTQAGIQEFPTTYNVSSGGVSYSCGGNFKATGYYGPTWFQFIGGGTSQLTGCTPKPISSSSPSFLFLFREEGYWRNALFPNEFRQVATPKKAIFNVPAGLELVSLRVDINNNSTTGNLNKTIPVSVTNQSYTLDVEQIIKELKVSASAYLDEGFEIRIYPSVVPTCKSTGTDVMTVEGTMAGTFWHRSSDFVVHQYRNSPEVSLGIALPFTYQTDNTLLSATVSHVNVNATTNQAKWVVQVTNSSSFRAFDNVWMGQSAATTGANIVSVQEVTDLNGTTTVGAPATSVGGVYQLGAFSISTAGNKYYLVTADYAGCDPGNITLAYGADCMGYPTSVASASCSNTLPPLNYTPVFANLQTSIVSQNAGTVRPKLCDLLPYEIEVNNAGIGDATTLVVSVPLPISGGLNYVSGSFQLTAPFTAVAGAYLPIADASVTVSATAITFTIPATNVPALKNGEKFRLKFNLTTQDCNFKSGQRISFITSGKNGCGSDIATTNAASSNRVTIDGSPINLPELSITLSSAVMNLATSGTDLTANYNFILKNVGDGINNYPATTDYSFNIKLPVGWVFAGNPQDLVPVSQAIYVGMDPVKGYVFNFAQDLIVNAEIKIVNATLVYTNTAGLTCNTNFGPIYESAYTTFSPVSLCPVVCRIDQLSVENQGTTLAITKPISPTGIASQTFCAGDAPTLASIVLANAGIVAWYDAQASTTPLDITTPLVNGQTYYADNLLFAGSVCESDRFAVIVNVEALPTVAAGNDQTVYATGSFTMTGNIPATGMTGLWTEVIPAGGTAQATIVSPADYNTNVTLAAGKTATLRWTITNGSCTASDDVVLAYVLENDLAVTKTADKPTVTAGETLTYTVKITNNGPRTLSANEFIGLTETLPTALTNITYAATGGIYDDAANTFQLSTAMATGQSVSLTVNGTVAADYPGTSVVNNVSITPPAGTTDADPSNNTAEVTTPVTRIADLGVVKTADKTTLLAGDALTYTIAITNNGPSTLRANEAINITESLPAGFNNLSYTSTGGTYDAAAGTFTLSSPMANGAGVGFTITGTVATNYSPGNLVNTVTVAPPTGVTDPLPDNNTDEVTTPVARIADLSVTKTANKTTVLPGDALTYTIVITNNGPSILLANEVIRVTENLPAGFTNLSYTSTGGTYDPAAGMFTLSSSVANGTSISFTIAGTVASDSGSGNMVNTVTVAPPTGVTDPLPGNNTADVTVPVLARIADLSVTKTANKTTVMAGETLDYTLIITNHGPNTLFANEVIQVVETLPAALNNVTFTSAGGTYNNGTFTLAADLVKDGSIVITVSGTVSPATANGSSMTNVVTVSVPAGVTDPVPANNTDDEITRVTRTADLSVVKTASSMTPVVDADLTFTIKAKNNGPNDATLVSVTDLLPTGYRFVSAGTNTGTFTAATGTWVIGNLPNGAEAVLTVTVKVLATGEYTNTATITGNETDPNLDNQSSTVKPVPEPSSPVAIDDAATTKANEDVSIPVLVSDRSGLSGSPLVPTTVQIITNPSHGTITISAGGMVIYTPNPGYTGQDNFTYRVQDALGYWSNVATVTITITANELKIPNVFTPNGDGKNDVFEIAGIEGYDNVSITIFNRWGNEVYRNNLYQNNWDGNGLNEGTYYYLIRLKKNGKEELYQGWVLLKH
jgi:gliding motility-associated-like protein/uncharacterized repeat protein (TIGR01451 family)